MRTNVSGEYAARVERFVATAVGSRWRSAVTIIVVALVCMLPGLLFVPPVDRDEPNIAIASRQMLDSGDLLTIPVPADVVPARGPGVYWAQAISAAIFGGPDASIQAFRVPSVIAAIAAALLTWWTALAFGRPRAALVAGVSMAASLILVAEAGVARSDALMLAWLVLTQGALARVWLAQEGKRDWPHIFLFWTGLGGTLATGGFTGLAVVLLTIAVISIAQGSFRWIGKLAVVAGVIWLLILVVPWFLSVKTIGGGSDFRTGFFGWDAVESFFTRPRDLTLPPGFYLFIFFGAFWPAAAFVGLAVTKVFDELKRPVVLFSLAWLVPYWILCEAAPVKFPDTILPVVPAFALLAGFAIDEAGTNLKGKLRRVIAAGPFGIPVIFLFLLPGLLFLIDGGVSWIGVLLLLAAAVIGWFAWRQLLSGATLASFATSVVSAIVLCFAVFGVLVPSSPGLDLSRRAVAAAKAVAVCPDPQIAGAGYTEPSLKFIGGDKTWLGAGGDAADFLAGGGCRVAVVDATTLDLFLSRADDIGLKVSQRGRLNGYDFAKGRAASLTIYTADAP